MLLLGLLGLMGLSPAAPLHAQTPGLAAWHSMNPMNLNRQACFDQAVQALRAAGLSNIQTQDGWNASGTNTHLHGAISCVQAGNKTYVDVAVASAASHRGAPSRQLRDFLRDFMLKGSNDDGVCRDLREGDPYHSSWARCCDIGNGKSRWTSRSGTTSDYNGTCKEWGIN